MYCMMITFQNQPIYSRFKKKLFSMRYPGSWSLGLRHEISSSAQTRRSWVRIPLNAWMSPCVCSVFVLGSGLATGWSPVQGVPPTKIKKLKWNYGFHECPMLQVGARGIEEVYWTSTDVSEKHVDSIFRVEEQTKQGTSMKQVAGRATCRNLKTI
jgi:hypothetical protein